MNAVRLLVATLALAALAGCGSGDVQTPLQSGDATTLADVKRACEETATSASPGRVLVGSELRDANVEISIDAPCLIALAPGAGVTLNNVSVTAGMLNLVDDPSNAGVNQVKLQHVTFDGRPDTGFLVKLRDAGDTLEAEHSQFEFPRGIVFKVFGHRGEEDNDGGFIRMEHSSLAAADEGAEGVVFLTSEHTGEIRLVQTTIETPADIILIAAQCRAQLGARQLDCSNAELAENLERQAEEIEDAAGG